MNSERLTAVESSLAFLEQTVQDLSDVICRQQTELDRTQNKLERLEHKMQTLEASEEDEGDCSMEKPPHY